MSDLYPIVLPKWGLSMEEGTIVEWRAQAGDAIKPGDELVDIETTKIANTLEAQREGTLLRVLAEPGATLPCGQLIGVIGDAGASEPAVDDFISSYAASAEAAELAAGAESLQPKTIEVNGCRIQYLEQGEGPGLPVLLIHGFGGDLNNWMFTQGALAGSRRVLALDLPGHGGSTKAIPDASVQGLAETVRRFLDALEIFRLHLVAHSLGGAVGMALAASQPERIASLTAIAPAGFGGAVDRGYVDAFLNAKRRRDMTAAVGQLFADPSLASTDMVEALLRYRRLDGVDAALRAIAAANFEGGRVTQDWSAVADRLLVIWGESDKVIAPAQLNAAPQGTDRLSVPGAGHMPHLERPDPVNAAIGEHLAAHE